jgi:hypothetical protein
MLAITAFAQSPPCLDPGITQCGITQCPPEPCAAAQMTTDDSVVPGQTETPPAADAADMSTIIEDTLIALLLF